MKNNFLISLVYTVLFPSIISFITNNKAKNKVEFNLSYFIKVAILFFVSMATLSILDYL